ncbi:hypothetical protein AMAG_18268 [Allomyces macrogynus ATCC 38327]|uniref:AAA+ ATPase domain-containing protein n=1 Tax=Allomyces macrogynus (strain ATCC 38327) TaxID=578462 RepID=A0A0L0S807_ALLM3|nr:hypothetical protein AMAG_18268 [Allomyces macrogynus ATCC 38327]|eukprot:KNE58550.1 hypothetical protein AMAG_18268 [Allomyces macrogynus ATCC 38327]
MRQIGRNRDAPIPRALSGREDRPSKITLRLIPSPISASPLDVAWHRRSLPEWEGSRVSWSHFAGWRIWLDGDPCAVAEHVPPRFALKWFNSSFAVEVAAALGKPTYLLDVVDLFGALWAQYDNADLHLMTPEFFLLNGRQQHSDRARFRHNLEIVLAEWLRQFEADVLAVHGPAMLLVHHAGLFTSAWQRQLTYKVLLQLLSQLAQRRPGFVVLFNATQPSRKYAYDGHLFSRDMPATTRSVLLRTPTYDQPHPRAVPEFTAEVQTAALKWFMSAICMPPELAPTFYEAVDRYIRPHLDEPWDDDVCMEVLYDPLSEQCDRLCWPIALFESALSPKGRAWQRSSVHAAVRRIAEDIFGPGPLILTSESSKSTRRLTAGDFAYEVVAPRDVKDGLDDVIGHVAAKSALHALIQLPILHRDQFERGVLAKTGCSGVLMYGPPGTGKTMLARATAKDAGACFIAVNPSDVKRAAHGQTEKFIKGLFETARVNAPCVVFLDEVDALFSNRDFDWQGYRRDLLNEFCMQWDGIKSTPGVIVVGTTNRPFDLDDAVLRRFSRRVLVDMPAPDEQRAQLMRLLADETLDPSNLVDDLLVPRLHGYSGSDIKNVCVTAAMEAVRELVAAAQSRTSKSEFPVVDVGAQERRVLRWRHFVKALDAVLPSVADEMGSVIRLREFAAEMDGRAGGRPSFGFVPAMREDDARDGATNMYVGESEKYIKNLFEAARANTPCVLFLDEVDALFSNRDFDRQGYRRDILNEFCLQWDGIKSSPGIIVVGTTNRPFDLDDAVLRRFSRRVLVDMPTPRGAARAGRAVARGRDTRPAESSSTT